MELLRYLSFSAHSLFLDILQMNLDHLISAILVLCGEPLGIIYAHVSQQKNSLYFQQVKDQGASPPSRIICLTKKVLYSQCLRKL